MSETNPSRRSQTSSKVLDKRRRIEALVRDNPNRSSREIAREVEISPDTVNRVKNAIRDGTFALKDNRQVSMRKGAILSDLASEGLALEESGMKPGEAAKRVQLSLQAYVAARDVLQLARNSRLREGDAARARAAVAKMDETCRPSIAYADVADLILKMWGGQLHSPHDATRRERVVEDYMHAIVVFAGGAERIDALAVPFLSEDERKRARSELERAKMAVYGAIKRLKGGV